MQLARRVVGWLAVGLAGLGGCSDASSPVDGAPVREQAARTVRQGLTAGPAERVKDVRTLRGLPGSSGPQLLGAVGARVFFLADDGRAGRELWVSDGTAEGTRLVEDLHPGLGGTGLFVQGGHASLDGVLYFATGEDEESGGAELWRTDGTPEGTSRVADLCPLLCSSFPRHLTVLGGRLYFTTTNGPRGLWRLDPSRPEGSPERLAQVKVPAAGYWRGTPSSLTRVGDWLYFMADDGSGSALWRSDGTEAGTARLDAGWSAPLAFTFPSDFTASGGLLYFQVQGSAGEVWRTDGTEAGTLRVALFPPGTGFWRPRGLTDVGGSLYFVADDGEAVGALWRSDGTPEGTARVRAWPGAPAGSEPRRLTAVGSRLFFSFDDGVHGAELWTSDGTPEGTRLVEDIDPAPGVGSRPLAMAALDGLLYFSAYLPPGVGGPVNTLWRSDGTAEGTWRVLGGDGAGSFGAGAHLVVAGGRLFFPWHDGNGEELWTSDGTAPGSALVKDIAPPDISSAPQALAVSGGKLFFDASDDTRRSTLWTSDGKEAGTARLMDFDALSSGYAPARPQELTDVNGRLFFFLRLPGSTGERLTLWRTDGTTAGTVQLRSFRYDAASPAAEPVVVNGRLYFIADDGSGRELWRSDGTPGGTARVWDLRPGAASSAPSRVVVLGTSPYFTATEDGVTWALWRAEGVGIPPTKVRSFSSEPRGLTTDGTTLFFLAPDPSNPSQRRLWRSRGTSSSTQPVQPSPVGAFANEVQLLAREGGVFLRAVDWQGGNKREEAVWLIHEGSRLSRPLWMDSTEGLRRLGPLAAVGSRVYFVANTDFGAELWSFPGVTNDGGVFGGVKNIGPAYRSGAVREPLFALEPEGLLLFTASDGASGVELWRTNGTRAGTWRVADVAPGRLNSNPRAFARLGDFVYFVADDGTVGAEPWRIPVAALLDSVPPTVTCPGPVTLEAIAPGGAAARYPAASASDDRADPPDVTFNPFEGATLPMGTRSVTATASDGTNTASCTFEVTVVDTTAPALSCPADFTAEATDAAGADVSYPPATVSDAATASPQVTYAPASGTHLPLGDTRVTVTAKDGAGNASTCEFTVTVRDGTAPTLSCPGPLTAEAVNASGAPVTFSATVADAVTASPEVLYSPASGSVFPLGQTPVSVSARDAAGNASTCGFGVTVLDTTPPALRCPMDVTVEATSSEGAPVLYAAAESSDAVTASPAVTYSLASGGTFALGTTPVEVRARDGAGNTTSCRFAVSVADTTAPELGCPEDVTVEATGPEGQPVEYAPATVSDVVTASPTVTYTVASGDNFVLGSTEVTVRATDGADNATACTFRVTVRDTTAPVLTCPSDFTTEPASEEGRAVDFPAAAVTDVVTASPTVTSSHASGSTFLPGETRVSVQATDAAGNAAECSFMVTVPLVPPATDGGTQTPDDGGTQTPEDGGSQVPDDGGTQPPEDGGSQAPDAGGSGPAPSIPVDDSGCGCSAGNSSASAGWGALLLLGFAARRRLRLG